MIQDTVQELQCHDMGLFCGQKYTYLKSMRLFTVSFDDVVFFFCELKPEKLAETIVSLKFLREMQGVRTAGAEAWSF